MKNYIQKAALITLAGLASYMPMQTKAGEEVKTNDSYSSKNKIEYASPLSKGETIMQRSRELVDARMENLSPIELASAQETPANKSKLSLDARVNENGSTYVGLRYSTGIKEFGNGMLGLITPYRKNPQTGKTEILPAYTHMFREGGLLSPEYGALICAPVNLIGKLCGKDEVLANPWYHNPALTGGMALDQLLLAIAAGGSGGGSSTPPTTTTTTTTTSSGGSTTPATTVTPTTTTPSSGGSTTVVTPPSGGMGD